MACLNKKQEQKKNILAQESKSLENKTLDSLNIKNLFFVYLFLLYAHQFQLSYIMFDV